MTAAEVVRRILRAALRRSPSPYEQRLGLSEYQSIQAEVKDAEIAAMARYHGIEEGGERLQEKGEGAWGVAAWNWRNIRGLVTARGRLVIYQADQPSFRQEIVAEAAEHGLKVRAVDRHTLVLEL